MSSAINTNRSPVAVVFGGRSPIAVACCRYLADRQQVCLVTRKIEDQLSHHIKDKSNIRVLEADLEVTGSTGKIISELYASGEEVNSLVFLQRYRPSDEPSFDSHCKIELWCIREAIESLQGLKADTAHIQILISSSPAARIVLLDQDLNYHIVKSAQEALVRYYAAKLAAFNISVTAIRIGSVVIKQRAAEYWRSIPTVVAGLKRSAPTASLQTSEMVGETLAKLATLQISSLTGQTITIDDGWALRDSAQIAKALLEETS